MGRKLFLVPIVVAGLVLHMYVFFDRSIQTHLDFVLTDCGPVLWNVSFLKEISDKHQMLQTFGV